MPRDSFWGGVALGAAGTVAGLWTSGLLAPQGRTRRVECSIQISRPAQDVFSACAHVERMPRFVRSIVSVAACDDVSEWIAQLDGRRFGWDLEIVQVVPKQVIGWKSHRGQKHSGRLSFFSLGDKTLVHIEMNYVPSFRFASIFRNSWKMEDAVNAALRDFKATLEATDRAELANTGGDLREHIAEQATGTHGPRPVLHPKHVSHQEEQPPESNSDPL